MFFHILTIIWRVLLFLKFGHPNKGVSATSYMLWKSSASGDLGSSLTALCVFLRYFRERYRTLKENENLTPAQVRQNFQDKAKTASFYARYSYYAKAWLSVCFLYFPIWTTLIVRSLNIELNLEQQDKAMTFVLAFFTLIISVLCCQVYSQMKKVMAEKFYEVESLLRYYFVCMILALAAQTVLVPMTSTNLSPNHEKIGNEGWDSLLEIQLFCDLFISVIIFSLPYVFYQTDLEASKCIKLDDF
jgi:hypothetical protein